MSMNRLFQAGSVLLIVALAGCSIPNGNVNLSSSNKATNGKIFQQNAKARSGDDGGSDI